MLVNFDKVDRKSFSVSERNLDGFGPVVLITPKIDKHVWSQGELPYRSLLCDSSGKVISSGFPKFQNYGESSEQDEITSRNISNGSVWFAEKMDGSLLIRSVINGSVHFRTRGSHLLSSEFEEQIVPLVESRYPMLLNPELDPDYSLLFEFTSPDNQIVLKYTEPCITALGKVIISENIIRFSSGPRVTDEMEKMYGTPAVKLLSIDGSIEEVASHIRCWKESEGIVVWCHPDETGYIHMAKIKAEEYIKIHSLKFQLTPSKIETICWLNNIESTDQLKKYFSHEIGLDWEVVKFSQDIFEPFYNRKLAAIQKVNDFIQALDDSKVEQMPTRKEQIIFIRGLTEGDNDLFSYGTRYISGDKCANSFVGSMSLRLTLMQYKNLRLKTET